MSDQMLSRMKDNLTSAKKSRDEITSNLNLLKEIGGNTGTMETDLHNLNIQISKQEEALKKRGII